MIKVLNTNQAGFDRWDAWLQKFLFSKFADQSQGVAANVFVWMLQVISERMAAKDM
jgi:hypothetical protein